VTGLAASIQKAKNSAAPRSVEANRF
jgi:hypothetical protein